VDPPTFAARVTMTPVSPPFVMVCAAPGAIMNWGARSTGNIHFHVFVKRLISVSPKYSQTF
jgi:hypothetical protein